MSFMNPEQAKRLSKITDTKFFEELYDHFKFNPPFNEAWLSNRVVPIIDVTRLLHELEVDSGVTEPWDRWVWSIKQSIVTQAAMVKDTVYQMFSAVGGAKLMFLEVLQTNTGNTDEEVDVIITVDGEEWKYDASVIGLVLDNITYGVFGMAHNFGQAAYDLDIVNVAAASLPPIIKNDDGDFGCFMEGKDVKVEVVATSVVDGGQLAKTKLTYAVPIAL